MVYLAIKVTPRSQAEIKKLEIIIDAWSLKVTKREFDEEHSIVKLSINASMPSTMNLVTSIAQSRFHEDLLESSMRYEYDYPLE